MRVGSWESCSHWIAPLRLTLHWYYTVLDAIASPSFASLFHTCCINNHKMSLTLYVFCQTLALYVFCQTFKLCILSNIEIEICSRVLVLGGTLLVSPLENVLSGWSGIPNFSFLLFGRKFLISSFLLCINLCLWRAGAKAVGANCLFDPFVNLAVMKMMKVFIVKSPFYF